jgi:hypothetical protein
MDEEDKLSNFEMILNIYKEEDKERKGIHYTELVELGKKYNYEFKGKTPEKTISSLLTTSTRKNEYSISPFNIISKGLYCYNDNFDINTVIKKPLSTNIYRENEVPKYYGIKKFVVQKEDCSSSVFKRRLFSDNIFLKVMNRGLKNNKMNMHPQSYVDIIKEKTFKEVKVLKSKKNIIYQNYFFLDDFTKYILY